MTKQEIEKYAEEKAQEFKEQIIKELSEKIEQEQNDKPYLIKKGEIYYVPSVYQGSIIADKKSNLDKDIAEIRNVGGCVARTELEALELYKSRKMQREYELWCMQYPCDWSDKSKCKYYAYYDNRAKKCKIECAYEEQQANVLYCSNWLNIDDYINIVGEEDFKKYVLEIGLKKYWLEV